MGSAIILNGQVFYLVGSDLFASFSMNTRHQYFLLLDCRAIPSNPAQPSTDMACVGFSGLRLASPAAESRSMMTAVRPGRYTFTDTVIRLGTSQAALFSVRVS